MYPLLLDWHGIRIHSYRAMMYLGLVFGFVASNYAANLAGLDSIRVYIAMLLLVMAGLVGARMLYVIVHWRLYRREPRRIWRPSEGGAAMQGGLLLAIAVSVPLLRAVGVPFAQFWDVAIFTALIWLALGRLGCFLHGCCAGRSTDSRFALFLPDHRGIWRRRIPTQLLEAGLAVLMLAVAITLWAQRLFPGTIFLAVLTGYALGRLAIQPAYEAQDRLGHLNLQQAISVVIGALALGALLLGWLVSTSHL